MRLLVGSYSWTKLLSQREVRGEVKGMGGGECYGDYSHLSEQVSLFCTCGSAALLVLLTLILCVQPALHNMMLFIDYVFGIFSFSYFTYILI